MKSDTRKKMFQVVGALVVVVVSSSIVAGLYIIVKAFVNVILIGD